MNFKRLLLQALGLVLIAFIISRVDIAKTLQYMESANVTLLLLAALIIAFAASVVKVARWFTLLRSRGVAAKRRDVLLMTLAANGIGLLTPAKAGDFLRALWVARAGHLKLGHALATVFVDRVSDLIALIAFGGLGMVLAAQLLVHHAAFVWSAAIMLGLIALFIVLSWQERFVRVLAGVFIRALVPATLARKTHDLLSQFYEALKSRRLLRVLPLVALLTASSWACILSADFFIAHAVGIPVGFEFILIVMPLVFMVELLPVSIAGLGTREAALIVVFSFVGVGSAQALAFGFMLFLFNTAQIVVGLGFYIAKQYPLR